MKNILRTFARLLDAKVTAFLDKEQRPGAQVVTESFVSYKNKGEAVCVEGVLGAIESERSPGSYVAFSGVEIGVERFEKKIKNQRSLDSLKFALFDVKDIQTLSVQLVLKNGKLFAVDLNLPLAVAENFNLSFSYFRESFRGRMSGEFFKGDSNQIKSVRFYLKRSENSPKSKEPLLYQFKVRNLVFD